MDILSIIGNLIAVASLATNVSERLRKLAGLRHVPQQIFLLSNEVSDFRCVLVAADQTIRRWNEGYEEKGNLELIQSIQRLIQRGNANLNEINDILNSVFIGDINATKLERAKTSWAKWLRKNGHLQRVSASLRDNRTHLSGILTVLMASEVPIVRAHLESISLMANETKMVTGKVFADFDLRLESVTQQVAEILPSLDGMKANLQQLQVIPQLPRKSYTADQFTNDATASQAPICQVRNTIRKSCGMTCRCRCHERVSLSSPTWLKDTIGLMFINYSGKPLMGKQKCNEKLCYQQQESSLLKITYYFPVWLLQRMIIFRNHSKSLLASENMISIRTPRITDPYSHAMVLATSGDVQPIQLLFSQGLASPYDTTPLGESLLLIATAKKRPDMCRLLLAESADPDQWSVKDGSPIAIVWDYILQDPYDPTIQELKKIFEPFLDADTDLQSKGFSIVHQCVLGLNRMNLENYLLLTTAEIESNCSLGRPPLFWAASSSNLAATKTLLKFGARVDYIDPKGQNIIHRAALSSNAEVLKVVLKEASTKDPQSHNYTTSKGEASHRFIQALLSQEDIYGWTPLFYAVINAKLDNVKVLLDYGAMIQTGRESLAPPLIGALQSGDDAVPVVELLLKSGAQTDVRDSTFKDSVLHMAATRGNAKVFRLIDDYKNGLMNTHDLNSENLTPLQTFDNERPKFVREDKSTFQENRDAFIRLLNSIDQWNSGQSGLDIKETSKPFNDEVLETASEYSDDEEFFDAKSF